MLTPLTRSHRFLSHCLATPWAMDPAAMAVYATMLARGYAAREAGGLFARGNPPSPAADAPGTKQRFARQGSLAVIPVRGPILQRASQIGECDEGIGTDQIEYALSEAVGDPTVEQILLTFDTPGGSVFGVSELADKMAQWTQAKPIYGIADSMSASAGYWLMAQCTKCYVTPGGMVGNIGVYSAHEDISRALEQAGVTINLVSAGKYKTEGNPFEPLSDEARGAMQSSIDDYYGMFTAAVARGRGVSTQAVVDGMGQGRCLNAKAALAAGLVDGVMPFGDLVQQLVSARPAGAAPASRARRAEVGGLSVAAARQRARLLELS